MRVNYIILGLVALATVIGLYLTTGAPEHAGRLAEAQRSVAFTGEARSTALLLLALGLGGFIAYLTLTRR